MKHIQSQLAATKHESMQGVYICGNNYVYICVASITVYVNVLNETILEKENNTH